MDNCIFCKIVKGEIPSPRLYEDENMIVIKDISPQAPVHLLVIPKEHYTDITELDEKRAIVLGKCLKKIGEIAPTLGLENGFRIVSNKGADGCQSVSHLHIHVLGGHKLDEKMG